MKWYANLKEGEKQDGINPDCLYSYKTTKDYDQQFSIFDGEKWIASDVEKFELRYLVD